MSTTYKYDPPDTENPPHARLVLFGVGGGGGNAVNAMITAELQGVEFFVGNTDIQALDISLCPNKIQLGKELTKGRGAGGRPSKGCDSAIESEKEIQAVLDRADMLFITAGMGGGTGTGAAPVIARLAKERGILTVGVVTKPFTFEGYKRIKRAEEGIEKLKQYADCILVIPNDKVIETSGENTTYSEAVALSDMVLLNAVRALITVINAPADVNLDFADVETVFEQKGRAIISIGRASGENFAVEAAKKALFSPLLEDSAIENSSAAIVCVTCSSKMKIYEFQEAMNVIQAGFHDPDIELIWGQRFDDSFEPNSVEIIVIATGFENKAPIAPQQTEHQHVAARDPRSLSAGAYPAVVPPAATPPPTPIRNTQQLRDSRVPLRESQHSLLAAVTQEQQPLTSRSPRFIRGDNSAQKRRVTDRNLSVPQTDISEPAFLRRRNNSSPDRITTEGDE